jgi:DNA gyrase subunit A
VTIRTSINHIREAGRATQGVKLIRLDEGDEIAATSIIREQSDVEEEEIHDADVAENTSLANSMPENSDTPIE